MSRGKTITRARRRRTGGVASVAVVAALGLAGTAVAAPTVAPRSHPEHSRPGRYRPGTLAHARDRFLATTVDPVTGDVNPYGVAVVPVTQGKLVQGDVVVGDFNTFAGAAGAGTSIVEIDPATGAVTNFANGGPIAGPAGLAFNPKGTLWVGDFGPANPSGAFDGSGGNVALVTSAGTFGPTFDQATTGHDFFAGTWGQAYGMNSAGKVSFYWPDAGTGSDAGTVWRLDPNPTATSSNGQPIDSTYTLLARLGAGGTTAASAAGPQGEAYDASNDTLYVADDATNEIVAIPHASTATGPVRPQVILRGGPLHAPQGIVYDPATHELFAVNGAVDNDLVELTTSGRVQGVRDLAPEEPAGALFGLTLDPTAATRHTTGLYYVNDAENSLREVWISSPRHR